MIVEWRWLNGPLICTTPRRSRASHSFTAWLSLNLHDKKRKIPHFRMSTIPLISEKISLICARSKQGSFPATPNISLLRKIWTEMYTGYSREVIFAPDTTVLNEKNIEFGILLLDNTLAYSYARQSVFQKETVRLITYLVIGIFW